MPIEFILCRDDVLAREMSRTEVHKFGGTSVADAGRLREVSARCASESRSKRLVVVASAMSGVTDALEAICADAAAGRRAEALASIEALRSKHEAAAELVAPGAEGAALRAELRHHLGELVELIQSVAWLRELSPRARSTVLATGEKLSVRLLAEAMRREGCDALAVDADTFLDTDDHHGDASPLHGVTERTIRAALEPHLDGGRVPVVTGFCGRDPHGSTTLLGRGGSDYTATLIGGALEADEVVIWTDVNGVFSADPRVVPEARRIDQLNFREAAELSYYGAKVLHQRTIIPVATRRIPVRIRNSFAPDEPGTIVDGRFTPGSHPVKAISAIRGQALISVEGKGMAGVPGISARLFSALFEAGVSVTMISQSSSESSICLAVSEADAVAAEIALKRAFRSDVSHGDVDEVLVRRGVGLVAAVGLGMAHTPGVARKIFTALGKRGINLLAIAQGSSELNISLAVDGTDVDDCVRAIHAECDLHRFDTGEESPDGLDLLLLGCGSVGCALIELILEREEHVHERFGLRPRFVAIADRSGYLFEARGIATERLRELITLKREGGGVADLEGAMAGQAPEQMVRTALTWRLRRPLLVDVTDDVAASATWLAGLDLGADLVTANKGPLAAEREAFEALRAQASARGRLIRAEATVGAGLPVLGTLDVLLAAGDELHSVEGCLSGTLAFLMTQLEAEVPLSVAVAEAVERGYTEPDPVLDLSGIDVQRKAIILGRFSGLTGEAPVVRAEGLVSPALAGLRLPELIARLEEKYDGPMAERVAACRTRGEALRYVARVLPDSIEVGPVAVPASSSLGMLSGPDNMIVIRSARYHDRPLVVSGPGAGIDVTAMGVMSDILEIAAERA